jgi:arylformamidase
MAAALTQDSDDSDDYALDARDLIDISVAFAAHTPPWPGDTPFSCGWAWAMADGASVNVSAWKTSPHVGTHADAPLHVLRDGAGADALPLEPFVGPARVADLRHLTGAISLAQLTDAGWTPGTIRLLLRTGQSTATGRFPTAWPALAPETAAALVADGLRLLAVDCPSVDDRESKTLKVHHTLFRGRCYVLENLNLEHVHAGTYQLIAPPLKVGACDAAPVRALLARR